MRLHFCLFSTQQAIPFIAIKRQEKLEDFCWDISWKYSTCPEKFDVEAVAEMVEEIERHRNVLSEVLKKSREKMRKRAFLNKIAVEKTMQLKAMEY
jgi:polysaccharide pyruvyl transferase WcaK-like protein